LNEGGSATWGPLLTPRAIRDLVEFLAGEK
jgi:hypothetical protein